jgi:hypothetical protein
MKVDLVERHGGVVMQGRYNDRFVRPRKRRLGQPSAESYGHPTQMRERS